VLEAYRISERPYYRALGSEVGWFEAAHALRLPVLLKGPTGCGKTRFLSHMAHRLQVPLVTVACSEDLSASDLVGRYVLKNGDTEWLDGPLTRAARYGGICYLDEVVEAREDALVVIHPLADDRRILPLAARGELVRAHPAFQLVVSYNPGYQAAGKDLKPSTRQRFLGLGFDYPAPDVEAEIVAHEGHVSASDAAALVRVACGSRRLVGDMLSEGISTRMLIAAGLLLGRGISRADACELALLQPLTDDATLLQSLRGLVEASWS
jgi:nitric oxide reductase NorQ protein